MEFAKECPQFGFSLCINCLCHFTHMTAALFLHLLLFPEKKGVHFYSYPFFSIYIFSQNNTIVDLCCALTAGIALKTFTKIIIALVLNCLQ